MSESSPIKAPLPAGMTSDMRLVAWLSIIGGGFSCLSIFGAIFGIPTLISGLRLKEATEEFDAYDRDGSEVSLMRGFERQSRYFFIQKVFIMISIAFAVFGMIIAVLVIAGVIGSGIPWSRIPRD